MRGKQVDAKQQELFRKQEMLKLAEKRLGNADSKTMQNGAQELCQKRDELLQTVIELQNEIKAVESMRDDLQAKLKQQMTEVVLCEKMIENFGRI